MSDKRLNAGPVPQPSVHPPLLGGGDDAQVTVVQQLLAHPNIALALIHILSAFNAITVINHFPGQFGIGWKRHSFSWTVVSDRI